MTARESFEDWWTKRGTLYPSTMKEMMWICFNDAWYRAMEN